MNRVSVHTLAARVFVMSDIRWYDPVTGRWLSPDPIGLEGGLNLHAFCGNDPVNYTDPSGLAYSNVRPLNTGKQTYLQPLANMASEIFFLGNWNPRHEEIFFEDGLEPKSYGYYDKEGVTTDCSGIPYDKGKKNSVHYRYDKLMRMAVNNLIKSGNWDGDDYDIFTHNCHHFALAVQWEYVRLLFWGSYWLYR